MTAMVQEYRVRGLFEVRSKSNLIRLSARGHEQASFLAGKLRNMSFQGTGHESVMRLKRT